MPRLEAERSERRSRVTGGGTRSTRLSSIRRGLLFTARALWAVPGQLHAKLRVLHAGVCPAFAWTSGTRQWSAQELQGLRTCLSHKAGRGMSDLCQQVSPVRRSIVGCLRRLGRRGSYLVVALDKPCGWMRFGCGRRMLGGRQWDGPIQATDDAACEASLAEYALDLEASFFQQVVRRREAEVLPGRCMMWENDRSVGISMGTKTARCA